MIKRNAILVVNSVIVKIRDDPETGLRQPLFQITNAGCEKTHVATKLIDEKTKETGPLVQLNMNLNIITQVAVGNNNTQVATVSVGQGNQL